MRHIEKRFPVLHLKALQGTDAPGTFEAIVATFGNMDPVGDVVMPGSFEDSIKAGLAPVVWSHDWMQPPIGVTLEMDELTLAQLKALVPVVPADVTGALYGKARLFVNQAGGEDVPLARAIHAAMVSPGGDGRPALSEFSWGGDVLDEAPIIDDGTWVGFELLQVDLCEWGPCLKGMNPETALLVAKALTPTTPVDAETARRTLARGRKAAAPSGDPLSPRQVAMAGRLRDIVTSFGKFDKTPGGNGAFYDADGNPFASRGVMCSNCIFYTPDEGSTKTGTCDMVTGAIDAVDWCKLFIIPAGKITGTSGGQKMRTKAALPVSQLPFAPRDTPWDAGEARANVRTWAGGDDVDIDKYDKAFLWVDDGADASNLTAYKFPVADVFAGDLKYVARGVFAAANVLNGGEGGTNIGDAAIADLKASVERLYAQMRTAFSDDTISVPWDTSKSQPPAATPEQRARMADVLLAI